MKSEIQYVHGYTSRELGRLLESADVLQQLLHGNTMYSQDMLVLEAGCGVGAQTRYLLERTPGLRLISLDIARQSLLCARKEVGGQSHFVQADLRRLPFAKNTFDAIFICFVLEHLPDPLDVLNSMKTLLKPKGTITAIEGDHGSAFFHPETPEALAVWKCLQQLQVQSNGDGHIGRRLYTIFQKSEATTISIKPLPVYCDPGLPRMMEGFVDKTIVGMLRGIEEEVISRNMIKEEVWHKGLDSLLRLSKSKEGTFMYTFFRAEASY